MTNIIQGTQGTGSRVKLVGVTGDGIQVEITNVIFPVLTVTNVIDTTNSQTSSTLLVETTKDNILSLVVLLKSVFKVDFAVGNPDDSFFVGILYTSVGIPIQLVFHDHL